MPLNAVPPLITLGAGLFGGGDGGPTIHDIVDSVTGIEKAYSEWLADIIWRENNENASLIQQSSTAILDSITGASIDIGNQVSQSESNITDVIIEGLILSNQAAKRQEGRIIDAVVLGNDSVNANIQRTVETGLTPILQGNNNILNVLDMFDRKVDDQISGLAFNVDGILDILKDGINSTILNQIILPSDIFEAITRSTVDIVSILTNGHLKTIDSLENKIAGPLIEALDIGNVIDLEQAEGVDRIADVMEQLFPSQDMTFNALNDDSAEGFGGVTWRSILNTVRITAGVGGEQLQQVFDQVFDDKITLNGWQGDCDILLPEPPFGGGIAAAAFDFMITLVSMIILPMNMAQIKANRQMQNYRQCYPDMLMQPGDLASALHRNLISTDKAGQDLEKQGYSTEDATVLLNTAFQIPDIQFLFSMYYRGLKTTDELWQDLKSRGYKESDIRRLIEISFYIPPPQDLISMAVREVFSEETARAQGQYDDFPEEFAQYAEMQGISREWAERYWAAHWRLPSEQMGFEMLHRRVIDDKKLESLLVALDIMPGWREEIKAISYNPLTRVDIRRMNALGVLDDQETYDAYLDIGYNPENAQRLLEFTKELNAEESSVNAEVVSSLTRSSIMGFYNDGMIDDTVALGLLVNAGIDAVSAALFIQAADFDRERKERKQDVAIILDKYRFKSLDYAQAADHIRALGLESRETELALLDLDRLRERDNKMPSKADLAKFWKAQIITDDDYVNNMILLGYNQQWARRYLELLKGGIEPDSVMYSPAELSGA